MRFSDRGGASGLIGARWANHCATTLVHTAQELVTPLANGATPSSVRVIRLDDVPEIARIASRAHLQNPDFLIVQTGGDRQTIRAVDAKFSVETAKSRQVSAGVVSALLELGPPVSQHIPELRDDATVIDGIFLCPDYALTRHVVHGGPGLRRIAVEPHEIRLLPIAVDEFMLPLDHERFIGFLAARDHVPLDYHASLLLTLYYFRLARAAVGFRIDQTGPLLGWNDVPAVSLDDVQAEAERIAPRATGAWNLILRWNRHAETVRQQRLAVDQAIGFPIAGKALRQWIDDEALRAGVEPPSANKVRRMAAAWMRCRVRDEFGPIPPPVDDVEALVTRLRAYSRSLTPAVIAYAESLIEEQIALQPAREPVVAPG